LAAIPPISTVAPTNNCKAAALDARRAESADTTRSIRWSATPQSVNANAYPTKLKPTNLMLTSRHEFVSLHLPPLEATASQVAAAKQQPASTAWISPDFRAIIPRPALAAEF